MEPVGLVPIVREAISGWRRQRRHRAELRRLLASARIDLPITRSGSGKSFGPGPWPFPAIMVCHWVSLGINEVLIAPRHLFGIAELESVPSFWTPGGPGTVRRVLSSQLESGGMRPEPDPGYHLRHYNLERYDEYHRRDADVVWETGWSSQLVEPFLPLWAEAFQRPWRATLSSAVPHITPRGSRCTISRQTHVCGVDVHPQGLGLRFEYHD